MKYFVGTILSRPRKERTVVGKAKTAEQFLKYFEITTGEFVNEYEEVQLIDMSRIPLK